MDTVTYERPEYWSGTIGYRPPGYADFFLNGVRAAYINSQVKPHARILDVGCAFGYLVRRLRFLGHNAWGIDVSNYAINHALPETRKYLSQAPAHKPPDGDWQYIVSTGVFEHLTEEEAHIALRRYKQLAPRGLISLACEGATHQHDDEGHELLKPLSYWKALMPEGYEVMDDDTAAWIAITKPSDYLDIISLLFDKPEEDMRVANELGRLGYRIFAGDMAYPKAQAMLDYRGLSLRSLHERVELYGVSATAQMVREEAEVAFAKKRGSV